MQEFAHREWRNVPSSSESGLAASTAGRRGAAAKGCPPRESTHYQNSVREKQQADEEWPKGQQINARPCDRLPTDSLARACRQSARRVAYLSHVLSRVSGN
jgi:hypothetical protein